MLGQFFFSEREAPRLSLLLFEGTLVESANVLTFADKDSGLNALPISEAIEWLAPLPIDNEDPLVEFWSRAAKVGVDLVARGRIGPAITPTGHDMWRLSRLDTEDAARVAQLAGAMPMSACTPVASSEPARVKDPHYTTARFLDAIADVIVRTPGASRLVSNSLYAADELQRVGNLQGLDDNGPTRVLGFRLVPPPADGEFSLVPYMQSRTDHSLVVDAAQIWSAEPAVLARLGDDIEEVMLKALRRAGQVWEPLQKILEKSRPDTLEMDEAMVDEFLSGAADTLRTNNFEIALPTELTTGNLELRANISSPRPASSAESSFDLNQLLELRWDATVDGESLSQAELKQLADAKRPLVRIRGKWVIVDESTVARLKQKTSKAKKPIGSGTALSAAMSGTLEIDGETMAVEVDSAISGIAKRLESYERSNELVEPAGLEASLRPYQRRGLAWLNEMCELRLGGCLADDMGLGKTVQVIALHLLRKTGPMLVICPASLLGNWEREIAKFAPGVRTHRFHGSSRRLDKLGNGDIVLATYGVVRRDHQTLDEIDWDLLVADEAQHAKNPQSQTAKSLRGISANVRLALTGTPVENQLTELWALLDWTTPGLLGPLESFRRNMATPIERFHDEEATAELAKIVRPFLLRRRKIDPDIAPELPQKTESDVFVTLTTEQASLYKAVTDEALETIKNSTGMERRGLILKLLTSLKQICNHPAQYLRQQGPMTKRSAKLAALDELIDGLAGTGESVLVFSQYVQMGKLLEQHLNSTGTKTLFLHGSIDPRRRDEMVEEFQAGAVPVFLLSLKAGGTGLNLTRATYVIHFDRWWNPAVEDQATDRAYRIGQTQPVQVHRLISEGTLEERIAQILQQKRGLSESVIGSGETWVSELDNDELEALVSLETSR
jgi:superfamily II DNA or RNA helicase